MRSTMASCNEESDTLWIPLEDGRVKRTSGKYWLWNLELKSLFFLGFLCLAVIVIFASSARQPALDELLVIEHEPMRQKTQNLDEIVASLEQIKQATTVSALNGLLASSIVVDAKALHDAISLGQLELLFKDFLVTVGSQAPDDSGSLQQPRTTHSSRQDYRYRLGIFKKNLLIVLMQNAAEYLRNGADTRARFGITVHADWTTGEFEIARLHPKAAHLAPHKAKASLRRSSSKKPLLAFENSSAISKPLDLLGHCDLEVGSCYMMGCNSQRAAVCKEGICVCPHGTCAVDGECVGLHLGEQCKLATGGGCHWFDCHSWRNAACVRGACVCPKGTCASPEGKCAPSVPSVTLASTSSDLQDAITCSSSIKGPLQQQGSCADAQALTTAQQLRYMSFVKHREDPGPISCATGAPKKLITRGTTEIYKRELDIANVFCNKGPVSIALSASTLMHYIGGIVDVHSCPDGDVNHVTLYTGIDKTFDDSNPVHILLNSWGPSWGVSPQRPYNQRSGDANGHILLKWGENVCNMLALASGPEDVALL